MKFNFFDSGQLEGGISISKKPEFTEENYWDLSWQEGMNKYVNDNFGFRTWCVKFINQIRYTILNCTTAPGVIIGKKGQLFIESYIDDYIGKNYVGVKKINETVIKIKTLQDSLKARGKDLIIVFAPGKASFYPELLPDNYLYKKKDSTNYSVYSSELKKNHVNFIDLNKWFYINKNYFKYEVYPKYGTHWNHYGMTVALDTILKYIEAKRNINIPDFSYDIVNYNSKLKGNDYDIGILMNLLKPIQKDPNPYPVYKFLKGTDYVKPDVLVVGDSYWWCLVGENLPKQFFKEDEYWFYNRDLIFQNNQQKDKVKELNFSVSIEKRDVIIVMATEATFYMFPYGFIDKAYHLYCEDNSKRINEIKNDIKNNNVWYSTVVSKAVEKNISIEKQMQLDAEYVLSDEFFKPKIDLNSVIKDIKNDPKWMEDIKKKAKQNNISEEEQLKKDAQWKLENLNKQEEPFPKTETLESIITNIKSNTKWMEEIKVKAKRNGISEEEQIKKDAQWQLDQNSKPKETLESIISNIRKNHKWMEEIKIKAKKDNISIEKQIQKDAEWQLHSGK